MRALLCGSPKKLTEALGHHPGPPLKRRKRVDAPERPWLVGPGAEPKPPNDHLHDYRWGLIWVAVKELNFLGGFRFPLKGSFQGDIDINPVIPLCRFVGPVCFVIAQLFFAAFRWILLVVVRLFAFVLVHSSSCCDFSVYFCWFGAGPGSSHLLGLRSPRGLTESCKNHRPPWARGRSGMFSESSLLR